VNQSAVAVVVVGAGPVGLVAAVELARRGIQVRIVDKLTAPTAESRAIAVHARSLEMFDRMGLVAELAASGVQATRMEMYAGGRHLARVEFGHVGSAFPFTVVTAQTETERILTEHLAALGVTVERGTELTGLTQDADAVHLTLARAGGASETADAVWVIGADGARSTVRHLVGTRLAGSFPGERFMLGDVEASHDLDRSSMYTYFSPDGLLAVFPMRDARMRLIAQVHETPGEPPRATLAQDELQRVVDQRVSGIRITAAHWLTEFEIHHAQVPAYRFGRVFLAGDAAHVHSPAGGQGMNTGMQDAFNLGWKLALAAAGRAGDELLDSYHAERHPVGAKVIEFTTRLTRLGTLDGPLRTALRNGLIHAALGIGPVRDAMASQAEEITIGYRDSPIVASPAHHGPAHHGVAAGDHAPFVADPAAPGRQLDAARIASGGGHLILSIAPDRLPAAPAQAPDGTVQLLIAATAAPVPGYDAVIGDPLAGAAVRYGLPHGGRVAIRPDGYIGLIADLDDDCRGYFARLAR
jgi:2-polyprenyl-6-methoxyphenol hydroxylase-like FAD-dependent oxidoreductase